MAKKKSNKKSVETLTHDGDKRKNIPTAEYQSIVQQEQLTPVRVAYERRNRDLDPQLVWRGKDEQDWSDLVVHAAPLYIQEKLHPKVLIDDLLRMNKQAQRASDPQGLLVPDLFADFNGVPDGDAKTEFYQHDANWTNRMILGDSLQVMASLAEREGLRGRVQCIYIDPPYGIKFNSNFQWSTTSRDVKDGNADHITREPEQVKAFRDTWRDGIHSYLTYLRDRLTVSRDLLAQSGSIFVQIGDENVHRIRTIMDEVFGEDNFISQISTKTSGGSTGVYLSGVTDFVVWYGKSKDAMKYRAPLRMKAVGESGAEKYGRLRSADLSVRPLSKSERLGLEPIPPQARVYRQDNLTSQSVGRDKGEGAASWFGVNIEGREIKPSLRVRWKTNKEGMDRLLKANRVERTGDSLGYVRFLDDFSAMADNNLWDDIGGIQSRADPKVYVVQTPTTLIQRCILMATDPGDLILDPTCGSGTTAYVAEQWGRRWITIDTSRVALALARARIMGTRYPYYLLADSPEGQQKEAEVTRTEPSTAPTHGNIRHGFVYERVPHITLKSIANNAEIDVIWEKFHTQLEPLRQQLNKAVKKKWEEWEIPCNADDKWPAEAKKRHAEWWKQRIARQKEIDASIAAKADHEFLYNKPYEDKKKVRVAGPFTVEQKSVKTTAFDLQLNPAHPGMQFHKLDKARDKNFWSVRVSSDIRLIVHKTAGSLLLCYVDHHDKAYAWAERRKLQTHPKTGAAQLVEVRETVQEIMVPSYVEATTPAPRAPRLLFDRYDDEELLGYGVPAEWLGDVQQATEDTLLALVDHLPSEAAEALLELATGGKPRVPQPATADPFEHPDAQRRFRVMANVEELARALEFPWEKWTVFLHPEQRQLVQRDYNGPARVSGSAGTGKTIVALHRAVHLARANADARVLLTTFSDALAGVLLTRLNRLVTGEPKLAERIDVHSLSAIAARLYKMHFGPVALADQANIRELLHEASRQGAEHRFSLSFLLAEWTHVVDAWQLPNWEAYRDVARLGRKTRLPEAQRQVLWSIFENVRENLAGRKLLTESAMFAKLADTYAGNARSVPFDFAVVDEAQDVGVSQMRFLAALGGDRPNALFFAGDLGQRIFQQPFSWKSLGVDIRGRSRTLRVNYRTSHQIRMQADRLLGPTVTDVDGISDDRSDTVSVFNGPPPMIRLLGDEQAEAEAVASWIKEQMESGVLPHELGIFVRSQAQIDRAKAAATAANVPFSLLDDKSQGRDGRIAISTMHMAKGLEYRAVAVMACDDEIIPLQQRIETVGDDADLQEVYDTERHLLYVACTRARDHLLITSVEPGSEFLDDLRMPGE